MMSQVVKITFNEGFYSVYIKKFMLIFRNKVVFKFSG